MDAADVAAVVADFGGGYGEPQWSRDSRSIYYHAGRRHLHVGHRGGAARMTARRRQPPAGGGTRRWARRRRRGRSPQRQPRLLEPPAAPRRIDFSVRMEIDIAAERKQVFEEAWRVMKKSLLRSQNARRELGRGQRQVRGFASVHRRYRRARTT